MLSVAVLEAVHTDEINVHCEIFVERQKKTNTIMYESFT